MSPNLDPSKNYRLSTDEGVRTMTGAEAEEYLAKRGSLRIVHKLGSVTGNFHTLASKLVDEPSPELEAIVREGVIMTDEGDPLVESVQKRLRNRLLRTYGSQFTTLEDHWRRAEEEFVRPTRQRRMLIPGLWPWGTIPMLGGNPKAGKTTVVLDLARSLVVPGYRFLDHFGPTTMTEEDLDNGVVLINAETPPLDFEDGLDLIYEDDNSPRIRVMIEHLEELGGANVMDLTDPAYYDMWLHRLSWCGKCDGSDERVPAVVIVEGVTAILLAAGKPIEAVGFWYAAFRRLMKELGVPNALAVGHNTLQGGHLMGGTEAQAGPDGLWSYSSDNGDWAASPRRFKVVPRVGGIAVPSVRVTLDDSGYPVIREAAGSTATSTSADSEPQVAQVDVIAKHTAEYVRLHPGAHGQELSDNISPESKPMSLEGRRRAVALGLIREERCSDSCSICERPHYRRRHYWSTGATT